MTDKEPNTYSKPLASGKTLWSWQPTSRDKKAGCEKSGLRYRKLGTDFASAMIDARELNKELYAWRAGKPVSHIVKGTFGWVMDEYQKHGLTTASERYKDEVARYTRLAEELKSKTGKRLTDRMVGEVTVKMAQNALNKLSETRGSSTARHARAIFRSAWGEAYRLNEMIVPEKNPFSHVKIHHVEQETYAATEDQLRSFVSAAIAMGEIAMAVAARLCWDMHERPTEVFRSTVWADWRPEHRPHHFFVRHEKRNTGGWQPLDEWVVDEKHPAGGYWVCLFRELEDLMRMMPRCEGEPRICIRERRQGTRIIKGEWQAITNAAKLARRIADKAGLTETVTLASFRHGGITALGEAGADSSLMQSRTKHRQRASLDRYDHSNDKKAITAQKLRLAHGGKK